MSLKNEIRQIEDELDNILIHLRDLRLKVSSLEAQNAKLLERLSAENIRGEGEEALQQLYDEGFHVCTQYFAKSREGEECLFCHKFLNPEK